MLSSDFEVASIAHQALSPGFSPFSGRIIKSNTTEHVVYMLDRFLQKIFCLIREVMFEILILYLRMHTICVKLTEFLRLS